MNKPRVDEVQRDRNVHVEQVVVEKGALFRKKVVIPAESERDVQAPKGGREGQSGD